MKKILLLLTILFISTITTACINNLAIQELNNKAVTYIDKGDAETAICRLKSSLDLDNNIYQTHYNLAVAYNSLGEYEKSIEELNTVLKLNPEFYDAYYIMGMAKEAVAYSLIEEDVLTGETKNNLTSEQINNFNTKASEAVEAYNEYLVKTPNAKETDSINKKIEEINSKILEYTQIYDNMTVDSQNKESEANE